MFSELSGALVKLPLSQELGNIQEMQKARMKSVLESQMKTPGPDIKYDAEMAGIHREKLLNKLLSEPEFENYDPHDFARAYADLREIAPNASMNHAIMRDFLRRRLEGGPHSYFDLEALTRIEKNLRGIGDDNTARAAT